MPYDARNEDFTILGKQVLTERTGWRGEGPGFYALILESDGFAIVGAGPTREEAVDDAKSRHAWEPIEEVRHGHENARAS